MEYLESIKELISAFPHWGLIALFIGGMACVAIPLIIRSIVRKRRFASKIAHRGIVVIESKRYKKRTKDDVNTRYFEYIKNAQYSTGSLPRDWKHRVNRIEK